MPRPSLLPAGPVLGLVAALLAACSGCGFLAPVPDGPGRAEVVAVDEALLHTVARQVLARPGVTCVDAYLSSTGVPRTEPGDPVLVVRTGSLPGGQRDALVRETGEQVWRSGPLGLASLRVTAVGADGASDLGRLLTGDQGPVSDEDLEQALGPRPERSVPVSPPADPGNPGCPR